MQLCFCLCKVVRVHFASEHLLKGLILIFDNAKYIKEKFCVPSCKKMSEWLSTELKFQHLLMYYFQNNSPHSVSIIKRVIKRKYINHLSFKIFRCKSWNICSFMVWLAVSKQNLFMKLPLFCFLFLCAQVWMYI